MGFVPEPRRHLTLQKAIPPTDGLQPYFERPCPFGVKNATWSRRPGMTALAPEADLS